MEQQYNIITINILQNFEKQISKIYKIWQTVNLYRRKYKQIYLIMKVLRVKYVYVHGNSLRSLTSQQYEVKRKVTQNMKCFPTYEVG